MYIFFFCNLNIFTLLRLSLRGLRISKSGLTSTVGFLVHIVINLPLLLLLYQNPSFKFGLDLFPVNPNVSSPGVSLNSVFSWSLPGFSLFGVSAHAGLTHDFVLISEGWTITTTNMHCSSCN